MQNSVFLDTSFLISLSVPARAHHEASKAYYQFFIDNKYVMFVSTIVLSEFCRKQPMTDLPMKNLIVVPFNVTDALRAAEFAELLQNTQSGETGSRDTLKDDVKIIAQADMKQAGYLITENGSTMARYCEQLHSDNNTIVQIIRSSAGFDETHFNGGQTIIFNQSIDK